jgi:hypothetical protein
MKGLTVFLHDWDGQFFILDSFIENGDTRYIGYFIGETLVTFISPCAIKAILKPRTIAR